jgi:hypothetical protein
MGVSDQFHCRAASHPRYSLMEKELSLPESSPELYGEVSSPVFAEKWTRIPRPSTL